MLYTQNIIITNGEEVVDIKELKFNSDEDFVIIEISSNGRILSKTPIDVGVIKVEESYLPVIIRYLDKSGNMLDTDKIEHSENATQLTDEELNFQKMELFIESKMDFPVGTKEEVEFHSAMLQRASYDKNAKTYLISKIKKYLAGEKSFDLTEEETELYAEKIFSRLYGMGVLEELDNDPEVGEIMVTASTFPTFISEIYYIKNNVKYKYDKTFSNLDELVQVFSRTIAFENKEINSVENAVIEATRENKDRINIIVPNASENYILNIRKFTNFVPDLENMKKSGTINDELYELLGLLVKGKANIGIGGEMGTGKTTMINYLLSYTEKSERKCVIASVVETDINRVLKGHDILLLTVDDNKGFTFGKLMKASLRTTSSRVIVPESRGEEFRQIYEANLKTKGNMFTAHALDDASFLDMCVDMYMSSGTGNENSEYIKNKLAKSIDIIMIMGKFGSKIRIYSISEVMLDENRNYAGMNKLYEWVIDPENPTEGYYRKSGKISKRLVESLNKNGVPMSKFKNWGDVDVSN